MGGWDIGRGEALVYLCASQLIQRDDDRTSGDSSIRVLISVGIPVM